jgi:hypothetical protein
LQDVFAVGPEHGDVGGGETRRQYQPVEAVVLDAAGPGLLERDLEGFPDRVDVDGMAVGDPHAEVVHGEDGTAGRFDAMRLLVEDLEAHVLEDRQGVGEVERQVRADELEADDFGPVLELAVEAHAERLLALALQPVHQLRVGHGGPGGDALLVADGEGPAELAEQAVALLLAAGLDQRGVQPVGPGLRQLLDLLL